LSEIKENPHTAVGPFSQEDAFSDRSNHGPRPDACDSSVAQGLDEPRSVPFQPLPIDDPVHRSMELFAGAALLVRDGRMLKLQHPPMRGLYVRDVLFAVDGLKNDFLALAGEGRLPGPVPGGFGLPAVIDDSWWMRPMWHPDLPAFRRQDGAANRACASRSGRCLLPRSIDDSILHDETPKLPTARHHWRRAGVAGEVPMGGAASTPLFVLGTR